MEKLKNLTYNEFEELVEFFKELESKQNPDTIDFAITRDLERFIPNINAEAAISLSNVIKSKSESDYNNFLEMYPELEFDKTGRSAPNIDYNQLVNKTITTMYNNAVERFSNDYYKNIKSSNDTRSIFQYKADKQIIDAFTLEPLIKLKTKSNNDYVGTELLTIFNKNYQKPLAITKSQYLQLQSESKDILNRRSNLAPKVLEYSMIKKENNVTVFIDHVIERVHLVHEAPEICDWRDEFIKHLKEV